MRVKGAKARLRRAVLAAARKCGSAVKVTSRTVPYRTILIRIDAGCGRKGLRAAPRGGILGGQRRGVHYGFPGSWAVNGRLLSRSDVSAPQHSGCRLRCPVCAVANPANPAVVDRLV